MRTNRGLYLAIFLIASLVAAGAYWLAQPRAEVVRARADIAVLTQITADMVEVIRVSPGDRPADAATSLDEVVGRYAALPLLSGQYVDRRGLETTPGQVAFGFGAPLPDGHVVPPPSPRCSPHPRSEPRRSVTTWTPCSAPGSDRGQLRAARWP